MTAPPTRMVSLSAKQAFRQHWPLYLFEAILLGLFMVAASGATVFMEYPSSAGAAMFPSPFMRRAVIGVAMGLTAVILIYSPLGKRSGAHMNPAFTLSFLHLRKMQRWDGAFYITAQFIGGMAGVWVSCALFGYVAMRSPQVEYIVTVPGIWGNIGAWGGEFTISLVLMLAVLFLNHFQRLAPYTGWFVGLLIASFVTFEAPLSGMSINPARTFGSAVLANLWTGWWIYYTAPIAGMLLGVIISRLVARDSELLCARLNHSPHGLHVHPCQCVQPQPQASAPQQ